MRYRASGPLSGLALGLLLLWVVAVGSLLVPSAAAAQEEEDPQSDETYDTGDESEQAYDDESYDDSSEEGDEAVDETNLEAIEDLLARDESIRSDLESEEGYDSGARRDPFRSLLQGRDAGAEETTARPEGVPGLLIDEIVVEGVFELADGPVAQVQASNEQTSYLIRPGDQLWDGDVVSISLEEVVFKQLVDDPTALKPFREVVKRLNP